MEKGNTIIKAWLDQGDAASYSEGVALYREHGRNRNLMFYFDQGMRKESRAQHFDKLKYELGKLADVPVKEVEVKEPVKTEPVAQPVVPLGEAGKEVALTAEVVEGKIASLNEQMKAVFTKRAALGNILLDYTTDAQRKEAGAKIDAYSEEYDKLNTQAGLWGQVLAKLQATEAVTDEDLPKWGEPAKEEPKVDDRTDAQLVLEMQKRLTTLRSKKSKLKNPNNFKKLSDAERASEIAQTDAEIQDLVNKIELLNGGAAA